MSETTTPEAGAPPPFAALTPDRLPPQFRKHADPKAPIPIRMMGAKGLVPLTPIDMAYLVALLAHDPDPQVAEAARKTASTMPDKILASALREESQHQAVLDFFAEALAERENQLELVLLNNGTSDATIARLAGTVNTRLAEIIGQNQLRILRDESIIRGLCGNPNAPPALIDSVCDFAVRSGLVIDDLEPMRAARIRIFGAQPPPSEAEQLAVEQEVVEAVAVAEQADENDAEAKGRPQGAWAKMNVAQKIRAASFKDSAFRIMALKDANKLVALAAIHSPRITDGEIEMVARSRAVNEDVLRVLYNNREWTKNYAVKLSLVRNPKVPLPVANRFLILLRETDLRNLQNDRNIPAGVRNQAKAMMSARQRGPGK